MSSQSCLKFWDRLVGGRSVPKKTQNRWMLWHSSKHAWLGMAISAKSQWLGHWFDRESKIREETRESASKTALSSHPFSRFDSHFCVSLQLDMWHVDALNRSFLTVSVKDSVNILTSSEIHRLSHGLLCWFFCLCSITMRSHADEISWRM